MKIIIDLHTKKMPDVGNPEYAVRVVAGASGQYPFRAEDIMCFEVAIVHTQDDAAKFLGEKVAQIIRSSSPMCFKGPNQDRGF